MTHETVYYSRPRTYGKGSRGCRVAGDKKKSGLIRKYGLNMSRQAFREKAEDIGFQKARHLFRVKTLYKLTMCL
ncbi:hypothetical protein BT93_L0634 [Corymbia citriodora subsp. variegata]|uniref:Uncharacterized protein n=1 Tax=Corymbia citriodora subsp. variegata TaxID=360336 RepID=A0A8T0CEQ0_CORYI|nr:hypothetical protein BT93_L0634 [Corymbia citriodora subsp. variegata]